MTLAWHVIRKDRTLGYDKDGYPVYEGMPLVIARDNEERIQPCRYGLHASTRLYDAISYSAGMVFCRVRMGKIFGTEHDKLVSNSRKIVRMIDGEDIVDKFVNDVYESSTELISFKQTDSWKREYHARRRNVKVSSHEYRQGCYQNEDRNDEYADYESKRFLSKRIGTDYVVAFYGFMSYHIDLMHATSGFLHSEIIDMLNAQLEMRVLNVMYTRPTAWNEMERGQYSLLSPYETVVKTGTNDADANAADAETNDADD